MIAPVSRAILAIASWILLCLAGCAACICNGSVPGSDGGPSDGGGATDAVTTCGPQSLICTPDEICITASGTCCVLESVCGVECCGTDEVCEAAACRVECGALITCGTPGMQECCTTAEVCYLGGCVTPGDPCDDLNPCPAGEYCEVTLMQCLPEIPGTKTCEYLPPPGMFTPSVEWEWTGSTAASGHNQVMMAPMVADLDLDGMPDIVFNTFTGSTYRCNGVLRAIRGDGSGELWNATDPAYRTIPGSGIALGDIDGDGFPEVITCKSNTTPCTNSGANPGPAIAFEHDGVHKWTTTDPGIVCGNSAPSIADLFQDGSPEIIIRYAVVDGGGGILWANQVDASALSRPADYSAVSDMDSDGFLDIVGGNIAYDRFGGVIWERIDLNDGFPAIADMNMDGFADVVSVSSGDNSIIALDGQSGATLWGPFDINQGVPTPSGPSGGGPPTIADFDGDMLPEVAAAGGYGYVVFESDGSPKWFMPTQDLSSRRTGSSVFDFDGDGVAEVVYSDELTLWVYAGPDGSVLVSDCATSGTLWEYPLVVDVDADNHAEIVTMNNDYAFSTCLDGSPAPTGIQVRGDLLNNWVTTRRIWNQHTYHVTNVNDDGTIPMMEVANWLATGLNNFRQNVQPDGLLNAPDLITADLIHTGVACPTALELTARVVNQGASGAPAPILVVFYEELPPGSGMLVLLGVTATTVNLLPGQSEVVGITWPIPVGREADTFYVVAVANDDGMGVTSLVHECDEANNAVGPIPTTCILR